MLKWETLPEQRRNIGAKKKSDYQTVFKQTNLFEGEHIKTVVFGLNLSSSDRAFGLVWGHSLHRVSFGYVLSVSSPEVCTTKQDLWFVSSLQG